MFRPTALTTLSDASNKEILQENSLTKPTIPQNLKHNFFSENPVSAFSLIKHSTADNIGVLRIF